MKPTRGVRIHGMVMLFTVPVAWLLETSGYAMPAVIVAGITGIFAGEAWHRWRESHKSLEG